MTSRTQRIVWFSFIVIVWTVGVLGPMLFRTTELFGPTFIKDVATIEWISDPVKVSVELEEATQLLSHEGDRVNGMAGRGLFGTCTIWAYEPRGEHDSEYMLILGHEMMHCFRGRYHEKQL